MDRQKKIEEAQKHLQGGALDGWLLYDFHRNNELAYRFLEIPTHRMATRRFFYWIPARGEPLQIVHAIEEGMLDDWPGEKRVYATWQSLEKELKRLLSPVKKIAMEYSPKNAIPYVSKVDAGTVDLIRSFGVEVASSAEFLLYFTAVLSESQIQSQQRAAKACCEIMQDAWHWIANCLSQDRITTEQEVQARILKQFEERRLLSDALPIVAVGPHSADPHFSTPQIDSRPIRKGDLVLIDLWAKEKGEGNVFGDITRVAVADTQASVQQLEVFHAVRRAQTAAFDLIRFHFQFGMDVYSLEIELPQKL